MVLHNGEEVSLNMLPAPFNSYDVTTPTATEVEKVAQTGDNVVVLPKMSPKSIRPLEEQEREIIEEAIRLCDGNITKAASYLEINPSTIYRKMKSWRGPLLT